MRNRYYGVMAVCLLVVNAPGLLAGSDKEALAVIDQAIKASGGSDNLAKLNAIVLKAKARIQNGDKELNFAADFSFSEMNRFRCDGELLGIVLSGVLNTKGCWHKLGSRVEGVEPETFLALRKILFALRAVEMLLPLKDQVVTLSHGGEGKVGDRTAIILKANHKDLGDFDFYFDRETGLPAKASTRVRLSPDEPETEFACVFSDCQEFEGVKHFTKLAFAMEVENAKATLEISLSDIKAVPKLEDELFAKPE